MRYKFEPIAWRRTFWNGERTLADDMADNPAPVDTTPHEHFHSHGGSGVHVHTHVHPDDHAHSLRMDLPAHEVTRA